MMKQIRNTAEKITANVKNMYFSILSKMFSMFKYFYTKCKNTNIFDTHQKKNVNYRINART